MFQAHETYWLGAGVFVCVAFFVALAGLTHHGKLKPPGYVIFLFFGLAFLQVLAMGRLVLHDNEQFRQELAGLNPLLVSNLFVEFDGSRRSIVLTNEINSLFAELRRVQAVPRHHSHPVDLVKMEFTTGGHGYQYLIGRDSARADEYWVFETARAGNPGREIGRIQSPALGQVLNELTHGEAPQQR